MKRAKRTNRRIRSERRETALKLAALLLATPAVLTVAVALGFSFAGI